MLDVFWWISVTNIEYVTYAAGPVFGNRDYFSGLAIFLDTYPNVGAEHGVSLADFLLASSYLYLSVYDVCARLNDVFILLLFLCVVL